jgi:hypothetical protein
MTTPSSDIAAWFRGRIPDAWFTGPAEVTVDRDEVLVVGNLAAPDTSDLGEDAATVACTSRIAAHREATREQRMAIARDAEALLDRKVAWGARCGDVSATFTSLSIPVMTRLRLRERQVLDTLIDAGIARSRSEALAWCVRLVGRHQSEWIGQLRDAMAHVEKVRAEGPTLD